jgi:hypothetical protein
MEANSTTNNEVVELTLSKPLLGGWLETSRRKRK